MNREEISAVVLGTTDVVNTALFGKAVAPLPAVAAEGATNCEGKVADANDGTPALPNLNVAPDCIILFVDETKPLETGELDVNNCVLIDEPIPPPKLNKLALLIVSFEVFCTDDVFAGLANAKLGASLFDAVLMEDVVVVATPKLKLTEVVLAVVCTAVNPVKENVFTAVFDVSLVAEPN